MPSNLEEFDLAQMLRCGVGLRKAVRNAPTMEAAARQACQFLYADLVDVAGKPACALVRCYKTHPFGALPAELQEYARHALAGSATDPTPSMQCLVLLGSAGLERAWNDRRLSVSHQAIPLPSASVVEQAPMVAQLLRAFGLEPAQIVKPSTPVMRDLAGKSYGVFHVAKASGSPYIPAQDFVRRYGVRSVVGFGGSLANIDLFAVIAFAKVEISESAADRFRTLALDLKGAFFGYDEAETFDSQQA